jgi:hypothetical protein
LQFTIAAECIAALVTKLETETVDFEGIGDFSRVLFIEQVPQVGEKQLAGHMAAEQFLLQGPPCPVRKRRAL